MTHIRVSKLAIIGSDNGLSPGRRQAIIRTNAGILWIGHLGTNFSEILIGVQTFLFKKLHLKTSSAKMASILSRPQWRNHPVVYLVTPTGCDLAQPWRNCIKWDLSGVILCDRIKMTSLKAFSNQFSCIKVVVCWTKSYVICSPVYNEQ